ncbi:MAG TPA: D-alanine--D-alanine ligase family protein [Solirubrobacteraceae bacterium]|nr:D-alanine--D-alanine ligase family protein [Solirubrobacteraceae bacterium]
MRIAVLAGGRSSEHDVSLASGESVRAGLREAGHDVVAVELARDGTWTCDGDEVELRAGRGLLGCDAAFPVLHGPFGEDGTVQGLLELLDVPYVGSGVAASAVCMDKLLLKDVVARAGLPQVAYEAVHEADFERAPGDVVERLHGLGRPIWVKPARLGSSVGIAPVREGGTELVSALEGALRHDPRVIVEANATGLEVECSVLGDRASLPGEIVLRRGAGWYDYEAKYEPGGMELVVPARIPDATRDRVRELAVAAFDLAGCHGLARVDFFVDGDDVLLNEVNTMPGFTQTSVYGKLWAATGVPYAELVDRLVHLALERFERERSHRF